MGREGRAREMDGIPSKGTIRDSLVTGASAAGGGWPGPRLYHVHQAADLKTDVRHATRGNILETRAQCRSSPTVRKKRVPGSFL